MMRIISGKARGIKLNTLEGNETRPTAERVKEAIFSMLQFELEDREILDLFSGSGQMALEAISRGAAHAVIVEKSKKAISIIESNVEKTKLKDQCTVKNSDCFDFIRTNREKKFDVIFIDPPYAAKLYEPVLKELKSNDMLKPSTVIVCESDFDILSDELYSVYKIRKISKYGKTIITLLEIM